MNATRSETGIGRALRKARLRSGKSLEEASRETRVKTEYLRALEGEAFDVLLGDVYVRGFLRSYSKYLGLDPEKVVAFYQRAYGRPAPVPGPIERAPGVAPASVVEPPERHRRTAWVLAAGAAVIVLVSAGAIGLLSRSASTPEPAAPTAPAEIAVLPDAVQVDMLSDAPGLGATVTVDGKVVFNGILDRGEAHSFEGQRSIAVHLDSGGEAVRLTVNGTELPTVGLPGHPYDRTFTPSDYRRKGSATTP